MMKYVRRVGVLSAVCLAATLGLGQSENTQSKDKLARQLIGEWRNQTLKIKINSYNNKDTTVIVEANAANWEEKLHMKPIRTHFHVDGSYSSEYRNLKDSLIRTASGEWSIKGDSIIMNELKPGTNVFRLHVAIKKNIATFKGLIDFDGDGKSDDEYYGTQRKFN